MGEVEEEGKQDCFIQVQWRLIHQNDFLGNYSLRERVVRGHCCWISAPGAG